MGSQTRSVSTSGSVMLRLGMNPEVVPIYDGKKHATWRHSKMWFYDGRGLGDLGEINLRLTPACFYVLTPAMTP
jgi:hypothetical protein